MNKIRIIFDFITYCLKYVIWSFTSIFVVIHIFYHPDKISEIVDEEYVFINTWLEYKYRWIDSLYLIFFEEDRQWMIENSKRKSSYYKKVEL